MGIFDIRLRKPLRREWKRDSADRDNIVLPPELAARETGGDEAGAESLNKPTTRSFFRVLLAAVRVSILRTAFFADFVLAIKWLPLHVTAASRPIAPRFKSIGSATGRRGKQNNRPAAAAGR